MSKRILFISPQPFFVERGSPIRAMQCLRAMAGAGYEVDILCYPFGWAMDIPGVHVIRSLRVPGIRHGQGRPFPRQDSPRPAPGLQGIRPLPPTSI